VPSVASEALPPTFKSAPPPAIRPQPTDDNAAPSPFESMLDDTQQADAPPPPQSQASTNNAPQSDAGSQPSQPSTANADANPAKSADSDAPPAVKGDGNAPTKFAKVDQKTVAAATAIKSEDDSKADDSKVDDSKADTNTDAQAAAPQVTLTDGQKPVTVTPVVAALPTQAASAAPAATTQAAADAPQDASAAPVIAAANTPATAKIIAAPKPGPQTDAPRPNPQGAVQAATPQADFQAAVDEAKAPAKPDATDHDSTKPVAADDKQQSVSPTSQPTTGHAKVDAQLAATAPSPDAKATPDGTQQLVANSTQQQTTQSAATAATQTPQQPAQPAPQAVPLAILGVEIAGKALDGKNRFDIRLDPPELGRIEVRLDVSSDGRVTSHLTADRPETLNLLQRDAAGLQRALEDAGLKTSDNSLQFSLRDQSSGQQQNMPSSGNSPQMTVDDETPIEALPSAYARLAGFGNGLDIRV